MKPLIHTQKILDVDLTERKTKTRELGHEETGRFVGGSGLNAWLLYQRIDSDMDAFAPENPLIFGAGPLVGTSFPTSARTTLTSLSPLTGIFGDSNGGGLFGVMIRRAGYDHVIIRGRSETPCYLLIGPDACCEIRDAQELWGRNTVETESILSVKHPGATVATIGPAGEHLVRFASVMSNKNANSYSRTGMGAVMGSKKLKAIVAFGRNKVPVHDVEAMNDISTTIKGQAKNLAFPKLFKQYGTMMFLNLLEFKGLLYGENWRRKITQKDILSLDSGAYFKAMESRDQGCFRCPLKCGKKWRVTQGNFTGEKGHGYEVAYILSLGLALGLRDIPTILRLVNKINGLGMDINELCGTVGMATDAFTKGIIDQKITDSVHLGWGQAKAIEKLVERTALRQGFGDILAEGTKKSARILGNGAEDYALHMKGMHWPAHSAPPFVMAFSLSTRGGDFLKGVPYLLLEPSNKEIVRKLYGGTRKTMDIRSHADKGRSVWWHENHKLLIDSLGVCFYLGLTLLPHRSMLPDHLAQAYRAATGQDVDGRGLLERAERGYQVERALNTIRGMTGADDSFTKRPEPDSWASGIDLEAPGMLDEYFAYRGLSSDGLPTRHRLEEVGLGEVADDLDKRQLLGTTKDLKNQLSLASIIKNPSSQELGKGLKPKVQDLIRKFVMRKMAKDPENLRRHFTKGKGQR